MCPSETAMNDFDEDDTHFCLKCHNTIVGLDNYIDHRKNICTKHAVKAPLIPSDGTFNLKADDFFSSLELQSSAKKLVQPSTSGKGSAGVLTRSKVTTSITTTTTTNSRSNNDEALDRRKDEETEDESEDYDSEDETSDEDAPPKNHTGGKWKPSSPVHWNRDWATPPPNHTGGKWKPTPTTKRSSSPPPPTFTGSKWTQSKKQEQTPEDNPKPQWDFPPPEHTKGKWKPEITTNVKEKTKLTQRPDDSPFRKSGGTIQYWCRPCNRRLASKIVYERHLKSDFHLKRTQRDDELEDTFNITNPTKRKQHSEVTSKQQPPTSEKKRIRKKLFDKCQTCNSKIHLNLIGKHLISHYHCRKTDITTDVAKHLILNNISHIIHESPFQCQLCRYFFNTNKDFLNHWMSHDHIQRNAQQPGTYLCPYCKFDCATNDQMYTHLLSEEHNEVVRAINRSVPIVIKKITYRHCGTCRKQFLLNIELKKHAEQYGHKIPRDFQQDYFKCRRCDSNFKSAIALQRHAKKAHRVSSFVCGPCGLTFADMEEARRHRNSEKHRVRTRREHSYTKCQYCEKGFDCLEDKKEHIKNEHPECTSRCPHCCMVFAGPQDLSVHLRTKSCKFDWATRLKYSCDVCAFTTDSKAHLLFHETLHNEPVMMQDDDKKKPVPCYKCPKCSKFFAKSSLEGHLRLHTDERPYTCAYCKATFVRKNNWLFHEKKHKKQEGTKEEQQPQDESRKFLCSTCGASFKRRFNLQQHMKIHTGKMYKCIEEGCVYAGRTFGELKIHYATHFDTRLYSCTQCDYKGKTKQKLARHATVHDRIKKFKCQHCSFTARMSHHLKRHMRLHTGSKPYKCPHCEYRCNSLENLRKHVLTRKKHPGKFLYECKYCANDPFRTNFFTEYKAHVVNRHAEVEIGNGDCLKYNCDIYRPNEDFTEVEEVPVAIHIPETPTASKVEYVQNDDVLPMMSLIVSKEENLNETWNLVECYDVEETGTLVPFGKDENEDVLFKDHF